jgi:hypothetical protein
MISPNDLYPVPSSLPSVWVAPVTRCHVCDYITLDGKGSGSDVITGPLKCEVIFSLLV